MAFAASRALGLGWRPEVTQAETLDTSGVGRTDRLGQRGEMWIQVIGREIFVLNCFCLPARGDSALPLLLSAPLSLHGARMGSMAISLFLSQALPFLPLASV